MKRVFDTLSYFVIFLLGLTPTLWFIGKGNVLINGVDTNFPLDPWIWFKRRFFVWNDVANAGGDFSSSTAGIFFHFIQVIPHGLGLDLQNTQIFSLVFWFLLIIFSSFVFAKIIFPRAYIAQLLFVVLYSFNIYLFNTWENIKVANLSVIAAVPLALGILILLKEKKIPYKKAAFYSSLVGIIVSGSGINPSYFLSFLFILAIFLLGAVAESLSIKPIFARIKEFLFVSSLILLVNSFWILPTLSYVSENISSTRSINQIAFTDWTDSLSENTSIVNIMRLQGAWDWYAKDDLTGLPYYIPYALNYFYRRPFIIFSFLIPALALLSLIFRQKGRGYLYCSFAIMLTIGVFLDAGTHLPTGVIYRWLLDHLPFFTLFRSPWYIFTPLVIVSYAALISLLIYNLKAIFTKQKVKLGVFFVGLSALILIGGNLVYSYPLITGKIFRPGRDDGFYVEFPQYIFDSKAALEQSKEGRIIGYPDDEIEKFSWGYKGIESILALFTPRETLFSPLNAPDSPVASIIKLFYLSLKKGDLTSSLNLASKLGADTLFEKKDQERQSISPRLSDEIKTPTFEQFGQWNFYKLPLKSDKIFSPKRAFFGYPYKSSSKLLTVLDSEHILINPDDTVVNEYESLVSSADIIILAQNSLKEEFAKFSLSESKLANRLRKRDISKADFLFNVPSEGRYQPILERYRLEDFGIDISNRVPIELDDKGTFWSVEKVTENYVYFNSFELSRGQHGVTVKLENNNLVDKGDFEGEPVFEKFGKANFEIEDDRGGKVLGILNIGEGASEPAVKFRVPSFDPMIPYLVELKYRQVYGNNALAVVLQGNDRGLVKAQTERLPNYPEWNSFSFYYDPVKTDSILDIGLVAPFTGDPLGTKVFYDDLAVYKVFINDLIILKESEKTAFIPEKLEAKKVSPVLYEGEVHGADKPHVIVFSENYSPLWRLTVTNTDGSTVPITPIGFSVNLYANAWFIDGAPKNYKFRIYYTPQILFNLGLSVSILVFISTSILFIKDLRSKR